jgi:hypothetical protein
MDSWNFSKRLLRCRLPPPTLNLVEEMTSMRAGKTRVADWLREQLGAIPDKLQPVHWLGLPQQRLLQVTAGAVFHDDVGALSEARRALAW